MVIVAQTTPILISSGLQTYGTFYVLGVVNVLAFVFILMTLPETKVRMKVAAVVR